MIPEHTEPSPAGLLKLAGFAMGLFAVQTFWGFTWATLPLYLKELTGSNAGTGVILSTTGITGLFFPVLAGALSDRIRTPLGRRRPLIVAGWLLAWSMVLLLTQIHSLAAAIPVIFLAYAGFFFAIGPYFALLPDIIPAAQRSFASGVMFLIGGTGILSYLLFAARWWEVSPTRPFVWVLIAVPAAVAVMCLSVKESVPPQGKTRLRLFRELSGRKNLLRFLSGMTLQWISLWMVSAFFVITCMALFSLSVEQAVKAFFVLNASFVGFALPGGLLGAKLGLNRRSRRADRLFLRDPLPPNLRIAAFSGDHRRRRLWNGACRLLPFLSQHDPERPDSGIRRPLSGLPERDAASGSGHRRRADRFFRLHHSFLRSSRGHAGRHDPLHHRQTVRRAGALVSRRRKPTSTPDKAVALPHPIC